MTTKNSEFEFDLQTFALSGTASLGASSGNITLQGDDIGDDTGTTTTSPVITTGVPYTSTTVYNASAYSFSGDPSAATVSTGAVYIGSADLSTVLTAYYNDSGTKISDGTPEYTGSPNTLAGSTLWLTTGSTPDTINVATSGSTKDNINLTSGLLGLTASNNSINYSSLGGAMVVAPNSGNLKSTINGANVNATLANTSADVTVTGAETYDSVTLNAGADVNLGAIDTKQTWQLNSSGDGISFNNMTVTGYGSSGYNIDVTSADSAGSYLRANLDAGEYIELQNGTNKGDSISVNGTIIGGLGKSGITPRITATDDASVLTGYGYSTITVGGAASVGGVADVYGAFTIKSGAGTGTVPAITNVGNLKDGGAWILGNGVSSVGLGSDNLTFANPGTHTIKADGSNGMKVGAINFAANTTMATLTAVGDHTIAANGAANWTLDGAETNATITANFDSNGNATVSAEKGDSTSTLPAVVVVSNTAGKTLAVGTADTLTMAQNASVSVDNGVISGVSSIAAESEWLVRGGDAPRSVSVTGASLSANGIGFNFETASSSVYGALGKSTAYGGSGGINAVSSLSGNVTLTHAADSLAMNVMGTEWTVSKEADNTVIFDATGDVASVGATATSDLTVTALSSEASVVVTSMAATVSGAHTMGGNFDGVTLLAHDTDGVLGVGMDIGISGITSLNSGATVIGDDQFTVNDTFNVHKIVATPTSANTQFTLGGTASITVQNVVDGDNYSVTGSASGNTIVYDLESSVSGGNAKVTVNAAAVALTAASGHTLGDAYIVSNYGDDVVQVAGVKLNDTITTTSDKNFNVIYDTSEISSSSSDPYVMAVNDARISLVSGNLNTTVPITMAVDNSSTMPHITISRGIANNTTVTVGAGVYNVGQSAQVTINDALGYLYVDGSGNVTAEDSLVAAIRQQREAELHSLVSGVATPTIGAFHDFYNIYYGQNTIFADHNSTVASYADATVSTRAATVGTSGVNIYGNTSLSARPGEVTLQSYLPTSINIEHTEGQDGVATLQTAVIDVTNGNNTLVAIGMNDFYPSIAANHTILGSSRQSTIMLGEQASGNNVVRAGNGGNYIYKAGGVASVYGGSGSDTIYFENSMATDHVEGGSGVDYFYDAAAYEISDYAFDAGAGDVIIASKLSTSANVNPANLSLSGNKIAIAGGATLTVGSGADYDEATATRAVITNAAGSGRTNLIWAGNYDSSLDASDLSRGALMISSINGSAANTLNGSAYADTVYAGANDYVDTGAGNDIINLAAADTSTGQRGATVVLSAGKNDLYGWKSGFDNEGGANILQATAANTTFKTRTGTVVASGEGASINFGDLSVDSTGAYNFLVGTEKVTFIGSEQTVSVNSNSDIADYYKGEKAAGLYVGSSVDAAFGITLGSDNFTSINKVALLNESRASIIGSAAAESITLSGSADAGAVKSVASGAGNDLIVSGGSNSSMAGNYLFFGEYGGVTLSSGRDTVQNFSFYRGKEADPDMSTADLLYLGDSNNYQSLSATASRLEISLGDSTKVVVQDNFATSDGKILRARFGNNDEIYNCKFGISNSTNTFTYDGETNAFFGSTSRNNDTLKVDGSLTNVNIWLKDRNFDTNYYNGVRAIDASSLADTRATLVGDSINNNIITAGASGAIDSLWGAGGQSNTLIGGEGEDTFFYFKSVGYTDNDGVHHGSNDVIQNAGTNDLVWLYDVTLNDISADTTSQGIVSGRVTVGLNDGSALTVTTSSSEVNFRISDGNNGWTDIKATGGSNHGWE